MIILMVLHNMYDFESFGLVSSRQYLTAAFMAGFDALFSHQMQLSLSLQISVFYHCLRSYSDLTQIATSLLRRGGNGPSLSLWNNGTLLQRNLKGRMSQHFSQLYRSDSAHFKTHKRV